MFKELGTNLAMKGMSQHHVLQRQKYHIDPGPDDPGIDWGDANKENVSTEPVQLHVTLSEKDIGGRHILVIGDVHGCLEELKEMISLARNRHPDCLFLFCGDLIDKGPHSVESLRYVRNLGSQARSIRGNHECKIIKLWLSWKANKNTPLKKKFQWLTRLQPDDIQWMCELPYTISIPHLNCVLVHAGLLPGVPLEQQDPWTMTEMFDVQRTESGCIRGTNKMVGTPWAELWKGPPHVFYGHASQRGLQFHAHATGLDSGCVTGNELTGIFLTDEKGLLHVKAREVYRRK